MSALFYSLKTEIHLKLQDYKFYLSIAFISILLFFAIPSRDVDYVPLIIDQYTGYYNSAFLGLYSAILMAFLFVFIGVYLIIGRVSMDYTTGVGQILASTHMRRSTYIWTRAFSHMVTLLTLDFFSILVAIIMQYYHAEVLKFNLFDYILPHITFVWPIILLVSLLAVFLELYFRNQIQFVYVGYFFGVLFVITMVLFSGFDLFGFQAFSYYLVNQGYNINNDTMSLIASIDEPLIFVSYPGLTITTDIIISRLIILLFCTVLFVLSLIRFDRFDPSRWSISLSTMVQRNNTEQRSVDDEQTIVGSPDTVGQTSHSQQEVPDIKYTDISDVSQSSSLRRYLILIRAELSMGIPRSKLFALTIVVLYIMSLTISDPIVSGLVLLVIIFPVSKVFSRDLDTGTGEIIRTMPQSYLRVDISRYLSSILMIGVILSGRLLRTATSGDIVTTVAVAITIVFVTSLAYGLIQFLQTDKGFVAIFLFWWYLNINYVPFSDFMFLNEISTLNILLYSILSVFFTLLGVIGRKIQSQ